MSPDAHDQEYSSYNVLPYSSNTFEQIYIKSGFFDKIKDYPFSGRKWTIFRLGHFYGCSSAGVVQDQEWNQEVTGTRS